MMKYDYLVVGSGLFGATFAYEANKRGKKCLIIEKRNHIGGNIYTEKKGMINVHKYGAHIFHTSNKQTWDYIQQFAEFNRFTNSPIAVYKDELYNLPFNMNTFSKLWNVKTPNEAKKIIEKQVSDSKVENPKNLEEQAISLVGVDIYQKLIKGYTEKQWGKECKDLPSFIIKRLPVRYTYDNNYFNDLYQGIPIGGYTKIIENMLDGIEIKLESDYLSDKDYYSSLANKVVYTGMIDQFFDYKFGELGYRSLRFEEEELDTDNFQGNAVVNYTEFSVPYTRIIEHKHFEFVDAPNTIITREYPLEWKKGIEPYYPINNEENNNLLKKYQELANQESNIIFGGRLGQYKYYDMNIVIEEALKLVKKEFE